MIFELKNGLFYSLRSNVIVYMYSSFITKNIRSLLCFRHPRMGDQAADPFVLPIFDTNYTVDLVWPPSETIDLGMLKKVICMKRLS